MAAATTDARHEFVTASVQGLVHLRSVPVVKNEAGGQDGYGQKASSRRKRKPRCYRALSGVSFQNSVDVVDCCSSSSTLRSSRSFDDGYGCWEMDRDQSSYCWTDQQRIIAPGPATTSTSPAGTVRVTFVHRTITDYSTNQIVTTDEEEEEELEEEEVELQIEDSAEDEDYDQSSASVSVTGSYQPQTVQQQQQAVSGGGGGGGGQQQQEEVDGMSQEQHIYDTPCSAEELYHSDLLLSDSDLSGLDLSIFEPGSSPTTGGEAIGGSGDNTTTTATVAGHLTVDCNKKGRKAFIYRPPRPTQRQLSRGKTFRERLAKPLQKFFHVPAPPAVDYAAEYDDHHYHCHQQSARNSPNTTPPTIVTDLDLPQQLSTGTYNSSSNNNNNSSAGRDCYYLLLDALAPQNGSCGTLSAIPNRRQVFSPLQKMR
jgi:hypothetical protein